jgi:hypothetical protein
LGMGTLSTLNGSNVTEMLRQIEHYTWLFNCP